MMHETVRRVMSAMVADVVSRDADDRARSASRNRPTMCATLGSGSSCFGQQMRENNRVLQVIPQRTHVSP